MSFAKPLRDVIEAIMREVTRRPPAATLPQTASTQRVSDGDRPWCRLVAVRAPIETTSLPDGSLDELHEVPTAASRVGASRDLTTYARDSHSR